LQGFINWPPEQRWPALAPFGTAGWKQGGVLVDDAMTIAASGMAAAMTSLTASASNVANADSAGPVPGFTPVNAQSPASVYQPAVVIETSMAGGGVSATVTRSSPGTILSYDPTAPFANGQGMVAVPNVDFATEAVNQMSASMAFQANLKVFQAANRNLDSLLDILV
jgi:flagellar basal-body rod protein FlgC